MIEKNMRTCVRRSAIGYLAILISVWSGAYQSLAGENSEPKLVIRSPEKTVTFTRSELLSRKDVTQLEVSDDPAYPGKKMTYVSVPAKPLFDGIRIPKDAQLQFKCLDGFSAPISLERLLSDSKDKSKAYIAIEPQDHKWPPLNPPVDIKTAGPFYLVWANPQLSHIAREEWPYQLAGFEVKKSLKESFPEIFPSDTLPRSHAVNRGFKVFTRDCFACHTMNLQGESKLGPDLNVPMSPTEYMTSQGLKIVIRDPQALRYWPLSKMHGFSKAQLSDLEMGDLLAYLKHMSQRKVKVPKEQKQDSH